MVACEPPGAASDSGVASGAVGSPQEGELHVVEYVAHWAPQVFEHVIVDQPGTLVSRRSECADVHDNKRRMGLKPIPSLPQSFRAGSQAKPGANFD